MERSPVTGRARAGTADCLDLLRRRCGSHERVMFIGHDAALQELNPAACYPVRVLPPRGGR